jgi:hypothetical protein
MLRYFTLEEANAMLPQLYPLLERIMEVWERLAQQQGQVQAMVGDVRADVGGPLLAGVTTDLVRLQDAIAAISEMGIELKDAATGLIDFPALRHGEQVYLCWRYGEASVLYWHPLHTGFAGRRPIEEF